MSKGIRTFCPGGTSHKKSILATGAQFIPRLNVLPNLLELHCLTDPDVPKRETRILLKTPKEICRV